MRRIQLSPYLNLQGRAREAMEFYHEVLGGKLELQAMDPRGVARPAGPGDRIGHARLEADGALLVASDGHPDYPAGVGDLMALVLCGPDRDRLGKIFDRLAEGGRVQMPLTAQPSGGAVGWLADRFGILWTLQIEAA